MNGIHDMGGMDGFGPVRPEANEPVFHAAWERRLFALSQAVPFAVPYGDDHLRREIERLPPAEYLGLSYYEAWLHAIRSLTRLGCTPSDPCSRSAASCRAVRPRASRPNRRSPPAMWMRRSRPAPRRASPMPA
jgi:nitrile hydratase subunit beta